MTNREEKIKILTIQIEELRTKLKPLLKKRRILKNNIIRENWLKNKEFN